MLQLQGLILRFSRSLLAFIAGILVFCLSFYGLFTITAAFSAVTGGFQPFDMQNDLDVAGVLAQLPLYTEDSRRLYAWFAATDFVFPLAGGFAFGGAAAFLMRHGMPSLYARFEARRGFVLFLLPTLFDYLENGVALAVVFLVPSPSQPLATVLVGFHQLKLGTLILAHSTTLLLALFLVLRKAGGLVARSFQAR
ncbi:hypothetical protein ACN28E_26135 [Archangium lansingense]|uniref:hypothetical protein n=1 Tax=Archangium lansingense TaxID=2995310 RepID=UPI003B76062C